MSEAYISRYNTTYANLSSAATYTGTWEDVSKYPSVTVSCKADQDGTMYMEFTDNKNDSTADSSLSYNITANINEVHRLTVTAKYYRLKYINGATGQTSFKVQSLVGSQTALSAPLNLGVSLDSDASLVRALPPYLDIASGNLTGVSLVDKFGYNLDIDTGTVPEDVWGGGGVYTGFPTGAADTVDVYSSSSNDADGGTGLESIRIYGLDNDWNEINEVITLNGTTAVTTANSYRRVFRMRGLLSNNGANDSFNAGIITAEYTNDSAVVFNKIPVGLNQTVLSGYTVPANKSFVLEHLLVTMKRSNSATSEGAIWVRDFGGVPRLTKYFTISQTSSHSLTGNFVYPEKTDIITRITQVSANNVGVTAQFSGILIDV